MSTGTRSLARVPLRIRWRDLDAFNHVNNSTFLTYLEEARLAWLAGVGDWIDDRHAPLLAATTVNYRRPLQWPGEIVVELLAGRVGTSSLTIEHRVTGSEDALLYSDGHVVMVWTDPATGRPVPLPASVRAACT